MWGNLEKKPNNFLVEEDQVKEHLNKLNILKPMGPYGMHSQVVRELVSVITRTVFIIFERSWRLRGGMVCLRTGGKKKRRHDFCRQDGGFFLNH